MMPIFDLDYYRDLKTRHPFPSLVPITLAVNPAAWMVLASVIGALIGWNVTR